MQPRHHLIAIALSALTVAACGPRESAPAGTRAEPTASEAKNATEQAAGKVVATTKDATITTKINAALAADDQLKATRIDVDTSNGHVVLTGTAPDAASRERATTLAKAVDGVVGVDNRLKVGS